MASLEVILEEDAPAQAAAIGNYRQTRMRYLQQPYEFYNDRHQGIELVRDRSTSNSVAEETNGIFCLCIRQELLFSVRGAHRSI